VKDFSEEEALGWIGWEAAFKSQFATENSAVVGRSN